MTRTTDKQTSILPTMVVTIMTLSTRMITTSVAVHDGRRRRMRGEERKKEREIGAEKKMLDREERGEMDGHGYMLEWQLNGRSGRTWGKCQCR